MCEEERCGPYMSNDEHNFGTPRTGRTMQFTPHLEFLNTSNFEVRKMEFIEIADIAKICGTQKERSEFCEGKRNKMSSEVKKQGRTKVSN